MSFGAPLELSVVCFSFPTLEKGTGGCYWNPAYAASEEESVCPVPGYVRRYGVSPAASA